MHSHTLTRRVIRFITAATAIVSLSGCALKNTAEDFWSAMPVSPLPAASGTTLPETPDGLTDRIGVNGLVRNVVDLTEQKRFDEARRLVERLRRAQVRHGAAWRAGLCAEMMLALRGGDMGAFVSLGETLEAAWTDPHRVDERCTDVVGLHRGLTGHPLPIDVSPELGRIVQRVAVQ